MSHDEYTKLYKYMQQRFAEIDRRFERVDQRFDQIYSLIDAFIKRHEVQEQEQAAIKSQLNRHDAWISELAKASNVQLKS